MGTQETTTILALKTSLSLSPAVIAPMTASHGKNGARTPPPHLTIAIPGTTATAPPLLLAIHGDAAPAPTPPLIMLSSLLTLPPMNASSTKKLSSTSRSQER